ncbi:MAG TPA: TSUP family transporter [Gammaproteobacteria bacterium]
MLPELIPELIAIALFAAFVSTLTLFSGFGLGTLLLPAFALFLPADAAVAATAVVHLANNLFKGSLLRRDVDWRVAVRFGLPAIVAALPGALLLGMLSGREPVFEYAFRGETVAVTPLALVLGGLILLFAFIELADMDRRLRMPPKWLPLGGALSGFFGGLSGHQGALRAVFLAPLGLTAAAFAATQALIAIGVDAARLLVYGVAEISTGVEGNAAPLIAAGIIGALAGALLGRRLLPKITFTVVRRITGLLLFVTGAGLASGLI